MCAMLLPDSMDQIRAMPADNPHDGAHQFRLPHSRVAIDSAIAAGASVDAIKLVLTEKAIYLRPGTNETGGNPNIIVYAFLLVNSKREREISTLSVDLKATAKLRYLGGRSAVRQVLHRRVVLDGDKTLRAGFNSFVCHFVLPASAPVTDVHEHGSVVHTVDAFLQLGQGFLGTKTLRTSEEITVISARSTVDPVNAMSMSHRGRDAALGAFSVAFTSPSFVLGGPLTVRLSLQDPPPTLSIFCVNVYIEQTVQLTTFASTPPASLEEVGDQLRKAGSLLVVKGGDDRSWWSAGFAPKAKAAGTVMFEGVEEKEGEEEVRWDWVGKGTLPGHHDIKCSTDRCTQTPLRFSSELVVEVVVQTAESRHPTLVKLVREPVSLSSCYVNEQTITLPTYEEAEPDASGSSPLDSTLPDFARATSAVPLPPSSISTYSCRCPPSRKDQKEEELAVLSDPRFTRLLSSAMGPQTAPPPPAPSPAGSVKSGVPNR